MAKGREVRRGGHATYKLDHTFAGVDPAATLMLSSIVAANGERMLSTSSRVGRPTHSQIFSSWLSVDEPWKIGFPPSISPKMHPRLHMSTALP